MRHIMLTAKVSHSILLALTLFLCSCGNDKDEMFLKSNIANLDSPVLDPPDFKPVLEPEMEINRPSDAEVTTINEPIDLACQSGANPASDEIVYPDKIELLFELPDSCLTGFEMNRLRKNTYSIEVDQSIFPHGTQARILELDLATYVAPDKIKIYGVNADGSEYLMLDSCRLQTATYGDPTDGKVRPPEDSIRSYRLELRENTRSLRFDFSAVNTPTYLKVMGLCEFDLSRPAPVSKVSWWRRTSTR
jgi:hypothetical protein